MRAPAACAEDDLIFFFFFIFIYLIYMSRIISNSRWRYAQAWHANLVAAAGDGENYGVWALRVLADHAELLARREEWNHGHEVIACEHTRRRRRVGGGVAARVGGSGRERERERERREREREGGRGREGGSEGVRE